MIKIFQSIPFNISHGVKNIGFRSTNEYIPYQTSVRDDFVTNPIENNFADVQKIQAEAVTNPHIREIMREYNLPIKVNVNELNKLHDGHLKDTRIIAAKIIIAASSLSDGKRVVKTLVPAEKAEAT